MRKIARVVKNGKSGDGYHTVRVLVQVTSNKFTYFRVPAEKSGKFIRSVRQNWVFAPTKQLKLSAVDAIRGMA